MSSLFNRYMIAVALSSGANIALYEAELTEREVDRLEGLLSGLAQLGHVAAFAVDRAYAPLGGAAVVDALRQRWDFAVDAVLAGGQTPRAPLAAYLMPVWPFDHERGGWPASTARFLHLDLEVIATPSADEELGVCLPRRSGHWLVHARPIMF